MRSGHPKLDHPKERYGTAVHCHDRLHGEYLPLADGRGLLKKMIADRGLSDRISVDSTGVSDEEHGHPIDPRAARVLRARGYDVPIHHARQITSEEAAHTDLLLPMTADHLYMLDWYLPKSRRDHARLYRSFDPALPAPRTRYDSSLDLVDPWYGGPHEFNVAIDQIEHVAPYIIEWIEKKLDRRDQK